MDNNIQRSMQLYTENEKKIKNLQFYYQLLALTRNNNTLYKSCVVRLKQA